jgi:phosphohistidine swiveling domain-containing protein
MSGNVNPMHSESDPSWYWTITNAGEAVPGVQTPLSISAWQPAASEGFRRSAVGMGVAREGEEIRSVRFFYGRGALSVDFLRLLGDRMPGSSGEEVVTSLIGTVPDGMTFSGTRSYYPNVVRRLPIAFARVPKLVHELGRRQTQWWRDSVLCSQGTTDEVQARRSFADALAHHTDAVVVQTFATFVGIQPVHDAIERVARKLGADPLIFTAPVGGAELEVVADIWRASRGELSVEGVIARHGFHGPNEGEASSRVWRDDDIPVRKMVEQYGRRPDSDSPLLHDEDRVRARAEAERGLVAEASPLLRPAVAGLLRLGRQRLQLRGVAKRAMVQGIDGVRASARMLGQIYADDGRLNDADDIFFLTADELTSGLPHDAKDNVDERRKLHAQYVTWSLPTCWRGNPTPIAVDDGRATHADDKSVVGVGVSAGIAEGFVRVVDDPAFTDVEDDEILVARTTDPSWSSIMFISSGLVVDIGGALSHAALVARELGIPCVVGTGDGTKVLRSGDKVRVDGTTGTVVILERAKDN